MVLTLPAPVSNGKVSDTLFSMVPVGDLLIDNRYARSTKVDHVRRLAKEWSAKRVGALYVSLRADGRYAVLDGCHRASAAMEVGVSELPCYVYIDLSIEQEAELFEAFNRVRVSPTPFDVFRARLIQQDPTALAMREVVQSLGLELTSYQAPGHIAAVAALESVIRQHGTSGLKDILTILHDAWGDDPRAYIHDALRGMSALWIRFGSTIDRHRLVDRLKLHTPSAVLGEAAALRAVHYDVSAATAYGQKVREIFNKGLTKDSRIKLPEWESRIMPEGGRELRHRETKDV